MNPRLIARSVVRTVRHAPALQLVAVSTVAIAVAVLVVLWTLVGTVDGVVDRWTTHARVVAFFAADTPADRLEVARLTVATWDEVSNVRLIDQGAALDELKATLGAEADIEALEPGLIPPSLEVSVRPAHRTPDGLQAVATRLRSLGSANIEAVDYGRDLVERLGGLADALRLIGWVLGAVVAFAVVFIISNTVRLTLYARRDELEIMQLVGATPGFIRAPVYVEGALQGLIGAGIATGLLSFGVTAAFGGPPELRLGGLAIQLPPPPTQLLVAVALGAALVGLLASHLAATRYLRGAG